MKITIGGHAGVGKGTITRMLAERYRLRTFSVGYVFRQMAEERGMSHIEFHHLVEQDSSMNLKLDEKTKEIGATHDDFIFEGRLAWYAIPDSIKILLDCELETRIKRVASREKLSYEQAKQYTESREALTNSWYNKLYGIENCTDPKHFDLVVDTTSLFPHEIIETIWQYIEKNKK